MSRPSLSMMLCTMGLLVLLAIVAYRGDSHVVHRSEGLRIASLSPSATEMLFALGVGDAIVAATDWCDYPPEAKRIKRVGGVGGPNVEMLLGLAPDIVVATDFERADVKQLLENAKIKVLETPIRNFDELFAAFRRIGHAIGRSDRAEQCIAAMQARLKSVADTVDAVPEKDRPRIFFELWDDPLTTIGGQSFVNDVITKAGGINVAGELPMAHPTINPEKVIEWNPDVMIVVSHKNREAPSAEMLSKRIGWAGIAAVKNNRILCDIPDDLILRPGPRLVDGVELLAKKLHKTTSESQAGE